jgi:hypothetical protein
LRRAWNRAEDVAAGGEHRAALKAPGAQTSLDPRGKERGTRRLRVIQDERTAMRLMGYDPGFIAKHAGGA